jgi:hypothetical protein
MMPSMILGNDKNGPASLAIKCIVGFLAIFAVSVFFAWLSR